ncbi:hypothetical protein [Halocola ammonii]
MDSTERKYLIIYVVTAAVIFSVTYYVTDFVNLRAKQIAENTLDVEYKSRGFHYALGITGAYSLLYLFFTRDMIKTKREMEDPED